MKTISYLFVLVFFTSCLGDIEYYRNYSQSDINIYLVKEGQITIHESDVDLNSLELERNPWLKNNEIEFYDWSSHTFYLNTEKEKKKYSGRHFVVVSGDERLFIGVFFPMYMSSFPQMPSISPEDGLFYPKNVIHFGQLGYQFTGNIEEQNEFRKALIASDLLREGIKVELTHVKKKNQTTIEYTFQVTNIDKENIYVLDPDKMGASRFHYLTNGVWLSKDNTSYFPNQVNYSAFDKVPDIWYFKLHPGEKMTRTVELSNFASLPSGKVKCSFSFPGSNMKSGEWKKSDGRIWIGDYYAEKELMLE
ncbi:MAG TPA: hypothetical protein VLQ91_02080 [Draconibacterium sp.]|nr:hypothetical protein [Draconibacterium sp.]